MPRGFMREENSFDLQIRIESETTILKCVSYDMMKQRMTSINALINPMKLMDIIFNNNCYKSTWSGSADRNSPLLHV